MGASNEKNLTTVFHRWWCRNLDKLEVDTYTLVSREPVVFWKGSYSSLKVHQRSRNIYTPRLSQAGTTTVESWTTLNVTRTKLPNVSSRTWMVKMITEIDWITEPTQHGVKRRIIFTPFIMNVQTFRGTLKFTMYDSFTFNNIREESTTEDKCLSTEDGGWRPTLYLGRGFRLSFQKFPLHTRYLVPFNPRVESLTFLWL